MKSVLISIQPKWCELIASGKKTVEVRKTRPKLDVPFKCYICCTQNNRKNALHIYINSGYGRKTFGIIGNWRSGKEIVDVNSHLPAYRYNAYLAEGKVIGEFVCDEITPLFNVATTSWNLLAGNVHEYAKALVRLARLTEEEMHTYAKGKNCYAWHISDLVIYDKPIALSNFYRKCKFYDLDEYDIDNNYCFECKDPCGNGGKLYLNRPPQSWCYVEEVSKNG